MPRPRLPIWLLMLAVLIAALYAGGCRVLMEPQVRGPEQSSAKIWVGFGLCSLTAVLLAVGSMLLDRETRAALFSLSAPDNRPSNASIPEPPPYEPLGLAKGQRLRLPDGTVCRVQACGGAPPMAVLVCEPPCEGEEQEGDRSEYFTIDREGRVCRNYALDVGHRVTFGKEETGWTLGDVERIAPDGEI